MAVRFNASGETLKRTSGVLTHEAPYTWMGWVKLYSIGEGQTLFATDSGGYSNYDFLKFMAFGGFLVGCAFTGESSPDTASNETWYHVAMVRESATSLKLYVDGVLKATLTTDVSGRGAPGNNTIGAFSNDSEPSNAAVAFTKMWDVALNSTEVAAEKDCTDPVKTANVWAYYLHASGALGTDASVNGRNWTENGTLTNESDPGGVVSCAAGQPMAFRHTFDLTGARRLGRGF